MKEIEITSIDCLISQIRQLKEKYGKQPIWFRGHRDSKWSLIPSIQRGEIQKRESFITNDFYIFVNQIKQNAPYKLNYAAWMSLMQHYGLPTRILDWSSSPLVACYFALENSMEDNTNACIWVLIPRKLNAQEGFGDCVYPIDAHTVQEMLESAFKSNSNVGSEFADKIIACRSVTKDLRMYSQQSGFTVHNSKKKLEDICNQDTLFKFVIPCKYKKEIFENVNILGISTRFIYPDMDHITKDIIDKYC